jgi:mono/diheme cytochrome c family protein
LTGRRLRFSLAAIRFPTYAGADSACLLMEQTMYPRLALVAAICLASSAALAQDARAQRGRVFAQTNCAKCHAIGPVGESPLRIAPPFRTLHTRYPIDNLAEALAEGIVTGHPTMPQFQLDVAQINDLLAYMKTLER